MKLWERCLDLLFPPKCPFCGRVAAKRGPCDPCRKTLPWVPDEDREQALPGGIPCASSLYYQDAARDGLRRFKFQGASGAADALGELVAQCAAECFPGGFDTVTWVPVSKRRLRRRGYDQCRLLAEAACRCWQTKPEALVRKVEDNTAQSKLSDAAARRANVLGVYEAVDPARIEGRCILLIDDIVTTGATLGECAQVLRESGAKSIVCVTLARTARKKGRAAEICGENT